MKGYLISEIDFKRSFEVKSNPNGDSILALAKNGISIKKRTTEFGEKIKVGKKKSKKFRHNIQADKYQKNEGKGEATAYSKDGYSIKRNRKYE